MIVSGIAHLVYQRVSDPARERSPPQRYGQQVRAASCSIGKVSREVPSTIHGQR